MLLALPSCQRTQEIPVSLGLESSRPPKTVALKAGKSMDREIGSGQVHSYNLTVQRGEVIELTAEQRGVDLALRLFGPSGDLLSEMDLPIGDLGSEKIVAFAKVAGEYRVEVQAGQAGPGNYEIDLNQRVADENDRSRAKAAELLYEGRLFEKAGDHASASLSFQASMELWERGGDLLGRAIALERLGATLEAQGDYLSSIKARETSISLLASVNELRLQALGHLTIGHLYFKVGQMAEAERHYTDALRRARAALDDRSETWAVIRLADVYKVRGETQLALDSLSTALDRLDRVKDQRYRAGVLHSLGTLHRRLGRRQTAVEFLGEAAAIYEAIEAPRSRAASLSQIGQLLAEQGDTEGALAKLRTALSLRRQSSDLRGESVALRNIGAVYRRSGDVTAALNYFDQATELLATVDAPRSKATLLTELGWLHTQQGSPSKALSSHREALAIFEQVGDPVATATALFEVGRTQRKLGDHFDALRSVQRALQIAEDMRVSPLSEALRISFFSTVSELFDLNIELLMHLYRQDNASGYAVAALEADERSRARSLLDLLSEAGAEIRVDASAHLLETEASLQGRLNDAVEQMGDASSSGKVRGALTREIKRTIAELDAIRAEIRRRSPRYANLTRPEPLTVSEIQTSVLDDETALLQYRLGADQSYLWLVTNDSLEAFNLSPADEIESRARRVHELLRQSPRRASEVLLQRLLCDLAVDLLGPIESRLENRRLVIAADGALHYLPFAVLPKTSAGDCTKAEPLIANHEIIYIPSATVVSVLRRDTRRAEPKGQLAVIADPVFGLDDPRLTMGQLNDAIEVVNGRGFSYRRLPQTAEEASAITELVPTPDSYLATGFEASKETVQSGRLTGYRVVHFATHGILNAEEPALSGVALSAVNESGDPIDGFLRAHEVFNLDLSAELVVLGACNTALGRQVRGEGLIGLTRGFMYAGAPSVMVTLWSVSDRGTAEFMRSFYSALLAQGLSPSAALRRAQLELRQTHPQPFYWAGFVLQGEWRAEQIR